MWGFMFSTYTDQLRQQNYATNADTIMVNTYAEGIDKVRRSKGRYAFLLEETANEYENTRKPCDTMKVGTNLNSLGYGIATKIGNPLRGSLNLAILYLQEKGELKRLENKWWYDRGQCDQGMSESGNSASLNLSKVAGIFYILSCGMVLSLVTAFAEYIYRTRKQRYDAIKFRHRDIKMRNKKRRRVKSESSIHALNTAL
uniref:Glutamate receptor 2 n=1 Tax=Ascaris suum TaxID=6253 RepID=F1LAV7_ASCSU